MIWLKTMVLGLVFFLFPLAEPWTQFQFLTEATRQGNPELDTLELGKPLKGGVAWDHGKAQDFWCSSFLEAEGTPPPKPGKGLDIEDGEALNHAYIRWTDTYSPLSLVDGDPRTAWVEGVPGPGNGEMVLVPMETSSARILSGFQKSPSLFKKNSRPEYIRIWVFQGQRSVGQFSEHYRDLVPLAYVDLFHLQDSMEGQEIPIPEVYAPPVSEGPPVCRILGIEILSVYPGTHYQDTAISEIEWIRR